MKLIHTADIHLGSKMDAKFPKGISVKRKEELRDTFRRLVDYARGNGVRAVLLAGDVFDSDTPAMKDRDFFFGVVRTAPEVDFLYLKGNHDLAAYAEEPLPNLKTFGTQWRYYDYGEAVVAGIEFSDENAASLYATLSLDPDRRNIVLLHGQVGESAERDVVNLARLRDRGIDYLALGHVHKPREGRLDARGTYAYCGCLEGRGFDEIGTRGFELLEVGHTIRHTFVPFAARTIHEADADIGGATDAYMAAVKVKEQIDFRPSDLYRLNLVGETDADVELSPDDVAAYLSHNCFFVDVKDKTERRFDWARYEGDLSLKGEFVRTVRASDTLTEEEKRRVAVLGLKALRGEEIDL